MYIHRLNVSMYDKYFITYEFTNRDKSNKLDMHLQLSNVKLAYIIYIIHLKNSLKIELIVVQSDFVVDPKFTLLTL